MPRQIDEDLNAAIDGMSAGDLGAVAGQVLARAGQEKTPSQQVIDMMALRASAQASSMRRFAACSPIRWGLATLAHWLRLSGRSRR